MKILCLIPAYNERGNLTELVEKLHRELLIEKVDFKILFILQGNDGSRQLLDKLKKIYPKINYLYQPKPLGIGQAYQLGFNNLDKNYSHILTLDADLNHQPSEIKKLITAWKKTNCDIIIGSRFIAGGHFKDRRLWKRLSSSLINKLIRNYFKINVYDISSGFRLIKREVIENVRGKLKEKGYPAYMELILLARKFGASISEVPISYIPRKWGKSKMNKLKTSLDYLSLLLRVFFNF